MAALLNENEAQDGASELRVLEFFSGIGGWRVALRSALGDVPEPRFTAFEISPVANAVYTHVFGEAPVQKGIETISVYEIDRRYPADVWLMSPPCQPYTRQNQTERRDLQDPRAKALLHLCELLRDVAIPPRCIILENVPGFETSQCCARWLEALRSRGFAFEEHLLSPTHLGFPNERLRYYCVAGRPAGPAAATLAPMPPREVRTNHLHWRLAAPKLRRVRDYVDAAVLPAAAAGDVREELLLGNDVLDRPSSVCLDVVCGQFQRSACFTKSYGRFALGTGSVLLMGATDVEAAQVAANRLTPVEPGQAHEELVSWSAGLEGRLRYFSPEEAASLMGFPVARGGDDGGGDTEAAAWFSFPSAVAKKKRYGLVGNSIHCGVGSILLRYVLRRWDVHTCSGGGGDDDADGSVSTVGATVFETRLDNAAPPTGCIADWFYFASPSDYYPEGWVFGKKYTSPDSGRELVGALSSIPEGVVSIGERAFSGSSKITELSLPSTLQIIKRMAFQGCTALTLAADGWGLPHGLRVIQDGAFVDCAALVGELVLPSTIAEVGENAFGYTGLTAVRLPAACKYNAEDSGGGYPSFPDGCVVTRY